MQRNFDIEKGLKNIVEMNLEDIDQVKKEGEAFFSEFVTELNEVRNQRFQAKLQKDSSPMKSIEDVKSELQKLRDFLESEFKDDPKLSQILGSLDTAKKQLDENKNPALAVNNFYVNLTTFRNHIFEKFKIPENLSKIDQEKAIENYPVLGKLDKYFEAFYEINVEWGAHDIAKARGDIFKTKMANNFDLLLSAAQQMYVMSSYLNEFATQLSEKNNASEVEQPDVENEINKLGALASTASSAMGELLDAYCTAEKDCKKIMADFNKQSQVKYNEFIGNIELNKKVNEHFEELQASSRILNELRGHSKEYLDDLAKLIEDKLVSLGKSSHLAREDASGLDPKIEIDELAEKMNDPQSNPEYSNKELKILVDKFQAASELHEIAENKEKKDPRSQLELFGDKFKEKLPTITKSEDDPFSWKFVKKVFFTIASVGFLYKKLWQNTGDVFANNVKPSLFQQPSQAKQEGEKEKQYEQEQSRFSVNKDT